MRKSSKRQDPPWEPQIANIAQDVDLIFIKIRLIGSYQRIRTTHAAHQGDLTFERSQRSRRLLESAAHISCDYYSCRPDDPNGQLDHSYSRPLFHFATQPAISFRVDRCSPKNPSSIKMAEFAAGVFTSCPSPSWYITQSLAFEAAGEMCARCGNSFLKLMKAVVWLGCSGGRSGC